MKLDQAGYDFIASNEAEGGKARLKAYQDTGGVWTIGFGTIEYPGGARVKQFDVCTEDEAKKWLDIEADEVADKISAKLDLYRITIPQTIFNVLVDFAYNEGFGALMGSTLWQIFKQNWKNPLIWRYSIAGPNMMAAPGSCRLLDWVYDNHKVVNGLIVRRMKEANLWKSQVGS